MANGKMRACVTMGKMRGKKSGVKVWVVGKIAGEPTLKRS